MGTLSEAELQNSLDFCVNLFNPTTPEQHARILEKGDIAKDLLDSALPMIDPVVLEAAVSVAKVASEKSDESESSDSEDTSDGEASSDVERVNETKMVLNKINARRVVHAEYGINNLEQEPLNGYFVRLERGNLGLAKSSDLTSD